MKKVLFNVCLSVFILIIGQTIVSAQNVFPKGSIGINAGFGIGNNTWGAEFMPSFNLAGDYAFKNISNDRGSLSGGAFFGLGSNKDELNIRFGVRGLLHYTFVDKLDTYGGIGMGLKYSKGKEEENYDNDPYGLNWGNYNLANIHEPETHFTFIPLIAGARFMFTDKIGAFSEVAISKFAYLQFGVSLNF